MIKNRFPRLLIFACYRCYGVLDNKAATCSYLHKLPFFFQPMAFDCFTEPLLRSTIVFLRLFNCQLKHFTRFCSPCTKHFFVSPSHKLTSICKEHFLKLRSPLSFLTRPNRAFVAGNSKLLNSVVNILLLCTGKSVKNRYICTKKR